MNIRLTSLVLAASLVSVAPAAGIAATQMRSGEAQSAAVAGGEIFVTNPERGDGFTDLGACEAALGELATDLKTPAAAHFASDRSGAGSVYNHAQGNTSRCELIDGEYLLVVFPRA